MSDYDPYGNNSRNFAADTGDELDQASATPFVTFDPVDPHPNASWGETGDAEFNAASMDVTVEADGSVVTRGKAGPANQSGQSPLTSFPP